MDTTGPNKSNDTSITDDVLHLGSASKLSAEEIAKAVAHHNRHHVGDKPQDAGAPVAADKKTQTRKPGK